MQLTPRRKQNYLNAIAANHLLRLPPRLRVSPASKSPADYYVRLNDAKLRLTMCARTRSPLYDYR